jgi:hypothetical protein
MNSACPESGAAAVAAALSRPEPKFIAKDTSAEP